jgi:predicted DNA-binding transcriptional regulator AlpA
MEKLIKANDVYEIVGFKQSKLRRMIIAGEFPEPIKFGNRKRWKQSEVYRWVSELKVI